MPRWANRKSVSGWEAGDRLPLPGPGSRRIQIKSDKKVKFVARDEAVLQIHSFEVYRRVPLTVPAFDIVGLFPLVFDARVSLGQVAVSSREWEV